MRTTLNIPDPALELLKKRAAEEGITLGAAVARAIDFTYRKRRSSRSSARRPMPLSSARGGPLPGIDLADRSTYDHLLGERL